ncbi:uncharacterized protein LOC117328552 [Pecten maximus]|uniref:uncharacterized protein LOC117328552 n=1 Tax=Pecten maximus TaxID=6579 RepID=UPI0014589E9F|nr:uncharacterized protein LOC117328552 [Pecten maximus]
MSDRSNFTVKSKVKEHLRQSLEDKCSKIGGRQIFFGLNDSMIRILTPVKEVVTPVPGMMTPPETPELTSSGNTITWTLSNPENCPESLSDQDITDVNIYRSRRVLETDVWSNIEYNNTRNKVTATQPKSASTTKPNRRIKISGSSTGQESDSADTVASERNNKSSRLSGGRDRQQDDQIERKRKVDTKNRKQSVSGQKMAQHGHKVSEIALPAIQLPHRKNDCNDQKQNKSGRRGNGSGSSLRYTNISMKCTLPPLEERSQNNAKKAFKTKSNRSNEIPVLPSNQKAQSAVGGQTRTSVARLPPIKSISGRDCGQRGSAREAQLTRSLRLHDTEEGGISNMRQDGISTRLDHIRLPRLDTNKLPVTDRSKSRGKESVQSKRRRN